MTLLDAYALIALLAEEEAAANVERLLREQTCRLSVIQLAETVDISQRRHRVPAAEVRSALEPLFYEVIELVQPREEHAWRAAELRSHYYNAKTCNLSLADCFLLAQVESGEAIATADSAIAAVARAEEITVTGLPDSRGVTP